MSGPIKQTRVSAFASVLLILCSLALTMLAGCPSVDTSSQGLCDAARRCGPGSEPVCGEDGQTYACAELARCEGVIVDATGSACMIGPGTCEESDQCDIFCPDGYVLDENGCSTCECEPVTVCPDVLPPECGMGERTVCDPNDVCGSSCYCEPIECPDVACNLFCSEGFEVDENGCEICECQDPGPICSYQPCPPNSRSECYPDRDGDGCDECFCVVECDDEEPPECDGPGERIICEETEEGCEKCWCDVLNCPAVEPPMCGAGERTVCDPEDRCGTDCWCEPLSCPPIQPVECERGEVVREFDQNGCSYLTCAGAVCPDFDCAQPFCPYGPARDEQGCETCGCFEPETCDDEPECDLFCEYGQAVSDEGCLLCACNPPPLCEPLACNLFCENGFVKDEFGCDTCACEPYPCLDDEQCGLYEVCVFDHADPVACCGPDEFCDASVPACVGECQGMEACGPNALCPPNRVCEAVMRDDCCHPDAQTCTDDRLACPLLCLEQ